MRSKGEQEQLSKNRMAFQAWFILVWVILIPIKILTIKGQYVFITKAILGVFFIFLVYKLFQLYKTIKEAPDGNH
jgi:hypothetical protein